MMSWMTINIYSMKSWALLSLRRLDSAKSHRYVKGLDSYSTSIESLRLSARTKPPRWHCKQSSKFSQTNDSPLGLYFLYLVEFMVSQKGNLKGKKSFEKLQTSHLGFLSLFKHLLCLVLLGHHLVVENSARLIWALDVKKTWSQSTAHQASLYGIPV